MKNLGNPQDKLFVLERLEKVRSDSVRAWGKMSAPQMICHLNDSFGSKLGEIHVQSAESLFKQTVLKWGALWIPLRWPHGFKTPPELDQEFGGTAPVEFEADKRKLVSLTDHFASKPAVLAVARHPFFGKMSAKEWMRWGYLHMDHHLRQFGC